MKEHEKAYYKLNRGKRQKRRRVVIEVLRRVVIEVLGGVADCTSKPRDVDVEIIDHDNMEG